MGLTSKDLLVVLVLMAIFVSFSYGDESHQHTVKPESLGPNSGNAVFYVWLILRFSSGWAEQNS